MFKRVNSGRIAYSEVVNGMKEFAKKKPVSTSDLRILERVKNHREGLNKFVPLMRKSFLQSLGKNGLKTREMRAVNESFNLFLREHFEKYLKSCDGVSDVYVQIKVTPEIQKIFGTLSHEEVKHIDVVAYREAEKLITLANEVVTLGLKECHNQGDWIHYAENSLLPIVRFLSIFDKNLEERLKRPD